MPDTPNPPEEGTSAPEQTVTRSVSLNLAIAAVLLAIGLTAVTMYAVQRVREGSQAAADVAGGEASRQDRRAWLTIKSASPTIPTSPSQNFDPEIAIQFVNSGRTPALHTQPLYTMSVGASLPDGPMPDIQMRNPPPPSVVGPDQSVYLTAAASLSDMLSTYQQQGADYFSLINSGQVRYHVFGTLSYQDIFGQPHVTEFCIVWNHPNGNGMVPCEKWNTAN